METITCKKCHENKVSTDFHKNKKSKTGLFPTCKQCLKSKRQKTVCEINPEKQISHKSSNLMDDIFEFAPTFDTIIELLQDCDINSHRQKLLMICRDKYPTEYVKMARMFINLSISNDDNISTSSDNSDKIPEPIPEIPEIVTEPIPEPIPEIPEIVPEPIPEPIPEIPEIPETIPEIPDNIDEIKPKKNVIKFYDADGKRKMLVSKNAEVVSTEYAEIYKNNPNMTLIGDDAESDEEYNIIVVRDGMKYRKLRVKRKD